MQKLLSVLFLFVFLVFGCGSDSTAQWNPGSQGGVSTYTPSTPHDHHNVANGGYLGITVVQVNMTVDQTVTCNGVATMICNHKIKDTNNWYNTSTGKFQPTIAGTYDIDYMVTGQVGSGGIGVNAQGLINGATVIFKTYGANVSSTQYGTTSGHTFVTLNGTTDYVQVSAIVYGTSACVISGSNAQFGTVVTFTGPYVVY